MAWFEVTNLGGDAVYVNAAHVLQIKSEPWAGGQGAVLMFDTAGPQGALVKLQVRETAAELYGWFRAARR